MSYTTIFMAMLIVAAVQANPTSEPVARTRPSLSAWVKKKAVDPRHLTGCRRRPWICEGWPDQMPLLKRMCCRNRCVDVGSDVNNCGFCGIRCPFTWQCCSGVCVDIRVNEFHCGRCWNQCAFGRLCFYGMCGYAEPFPPFPFPFPFPPNSPKLESPLLPLPPKLQSPAA